MIELIQTIEYKIRRIIAEQAVLEIEDVTPEASLESLGIDSLGLVESIFAIEEEFDISIPFNANQPKLGPFAGSTVGSIVAVVTEMVKAAGR